MRKNSLQAAADCVDPLDKIRQMTFRALEYFYEEPFFTAILEMNEEIYAPYKQKKFEKYVQTGIVNIINRLLKDGIEQGTVRNIDTQLTAYCIFKIFQSLTYARTIPYPSNTEELKQEYAKIFEILKTGLV